MSSVFVGNDVVDLANPRTHGRAADTRFVQRVLGDREQAELHAMGGSDVELWSRWAAKEAGFKAISKALGSVPPFVHRAYEVAWTDVLDPGEPGPGGADPEGVLVRVGTVSHAGRVAGVRVWASRSTVHAVAVLALEERVDAAEVHRRLVRLGDPSSRRTEPQEELMRRFTDREADAVRTLESAAVRLGARADLARLLDVAEERVEIVCAPGPATRRPPCVLLDGSDASADVSLAHDGGWIAWAIWVAA